MKQLNQFRRKTFNRSGTNDKLSDPEQLRYSNCQTSDP